MNLHSNECAANPDEVAEAYIMGTLSKEQEATFEDHYICCDRCVTALQKAAEYVAAMRAAGTDVRSEPGSRVTSGR